MMSVGTVAYNNKIHPKKFALWVACASIVMMFAAFTSSYLVRRSAGNWLEFPLPSVFTVSTGIILLSSVVMHLAYLAFKKGNALVYKAGLLTTFLLGIGFLIAQYMGWNALQQMGVMLNTNPSGSFVYVISGVHAAHILGGIAVLLVAMIHAFTLPFKVTPNRLLRLEMSMTYWHFVDFLWVYLFFFFISQS